MLNLIDYQNLWTGTLGNAIHTLPCYYQYLQREVYFQDYLDLFGVVHGPTYTRVLHMGNYYVALPALAPDPTGTYTVIIAGAVHLSVDYDFPFPVELNKKRLVKYVLVGEAAPEPSIPHLVGGLDKNNSFFYNHTHVKTSRYLGAPVSAFGIVGHLKIDKLVQLANAGFLLLDLFPFSISYTNLRAMIAYHDFWNLLCHKICQLNNVGKLGQPYLGFAGPAVLHHRIVNDLLAAPAPIITLPACLPIHVNFSLNHLWSGASGLAGGHLEPYGSTWGPIPVGGGYCINGNPLWPIHPNRHGNIYLPLHACECWDNSFVGPNAMFIKVAFDLP